MTDKTEKTQLKFVKSPKTGKFVGFVSKTKDNILKGVREESIYRKRICILSEELERMVLPDTLYDVELKPMHRKNGYVVTSAVRVLFNATVESFVVPGKKYQVIVHFGGKTVYFDPLNGRTSSSRTKAGVLAILNKRNDISNQNGVISDFLDRAEEVIRQMREDGYDVR